MGMFSTVVGRTSTSLIVACSLVLSFGACANPQLIEAPPPKPVVKKVAPQGPDAFRDFGGKRVKKGEVFRLEAMDMVGVAGHRIVLRLVKTEWTTRELPSGKKLKEGTADIEIQKGEKTKRKRIDQEETRTVFGAKITVRGAGEMYSKKRMQYVPWVEIVVN
ncbi:MAG: hypothetical protein KC502_14985 [Myxococcales bacterium]|nr:hypothetical protein [Myxococcales bacterium]